MFVMNLGNPIVSDLANSLSIGFPNPDEKMPSWSKNSARKHMQERVKVPYLLGNIDSLEN